MSAPDTATYATPALRTLVTEAARLNRVVPATLAGYRARAESEISFGFRDGIGNESAISVEQLASAVSWTRASGMMQEVLGYRTPAFGLASLVGFYKGSWLTPMLYGNRFVVFWGSARRDSTKGAKRDTITRRAGVHPLAIDRDDFYRYGGGDTVQTLRINGREIPIVRVNVRAKQNLPRETAVFEGELDLDGRTAHVVRIRGTFSIVRGPGQTAAGGAMRAVGHQILEFAEFIEIVNSEIERDYWLPQYERLELQIAAPILGDATEVIRIVSHVRDYEVARGNAATAAAIPDSVRMRAGTIRFAPRDTLNAFRGWHEQMGVATSDVSADDFVDLGPPRSRPTGPPSITPQCERASDCVHYNRVEGLYTGMGIRAKLRDALPGLTIRANGGYAWSEETVRGRASAELVRGPWTYALRGGRSLDITNDFHTSLDSGSTIGAVFGIDDFDYVDRRSAGVSLQRTLVRRKARIRLELGTASDRAAINHRNYGVFGDQAFQPNRGVDEGRYARTALTVEWKPSALNETVWPGLGAALSYVRGDGELDFQRVELRSHTQRFVGPWTIRYTLNAGAVFGSRPPPQQLFELTGDRGLPGHRYKEFAGDQAFSVGAMVAYRFPWWRAPHTIWRGKRGLGIVFPGASPQLAARIETEWVGVSGDAARAAVGRLGMRTVRDSAGVTSFVPASVPLGRARISVAAGVLLFNGFLTASVSRAIDRYERWKFQFGF